MFLSEYDEEKVLQQERHEAYQEGFQEEFQKGIEEARIEIAKNLLSMGGMSAAQIACICILSEEAVLKLAAEMSVY